MISTIVLKPKLSEKAYALSEARTYVFVVPVGVNSQMVGKAVAKQYGVNVESVRMAASAAKSRRAYRKRGRSVDVTRAGFRKAYVTLNEGDSLPFFTSDEPAKKSKQTKEAA